MNFFCFLRALIFYEWKSDILIVKQKFNCNCAQLKTHDKGKQTTVLENQILIFLKSGYFSILN